LESSWDFTSIKIHEASATIKYTEFDMFAETVYLESAGLPLVVLRNTGGS